MKTKAVTHVTAVVSIGILLLFVFNSNAAENGDAKKLKILKVDSKEPMAKSFSLEKGISFLDETSMAWTNKYKCFTCHTNFIHQIAVSDLEKKPAHYFTVRGKLVELVEKRWKNSGPRWDAEVVMAATSLAFHDRNNSGKLSPVTHTALDRIWKVQKPNGGFDWLKCNWPPMESDDEYGAVIAAVGVSAAPEEYLKSDSAHAGVKKLKDYLKKHRIEKLHHRAMLIWAESLASGWISKSESNAIVAELLKLQNPDGGWNTPSLGDWDRDDGAKPDKKTSDGYATGFALFILRKGGVSADSKSILNGLKWLKANQRESGRWYTRSVSRDNKHFLTHAGTAMSIMAIRACEDNNEIED